MKRVVRRSGLANGALTCPVILASTGLLCWLWPATLSAAGAISYVQGNYAVPQTSQTTVTVTFSAAQSAGDLNVVVVGWNDSTATVSTVVDTRGNMYTRAVGPTVVSGALSQSIYYAKNIAAAAAGANTVTVTFSKAANSADIRILEYSGADVSNPVDITARASGNNANSSSGAVTTTNATDLVFGANIVVTSTNGPGSGFTQRLLTSPDGDIAEDRFVTATGSYSATAPLDSSGRWIMQMVAFRAAGSAVGVAPAITSGSSTTFVVGTMGSFTVMATGTPTPSLTETGALPSGVTFKDNGNGTATLGGTPTTGTAGSYAITITAQNGVPPNATQSFTLTVNQAPTITSVNNTTFTVGTAGSFAVTATGTPTP
ncbi:MAG TPA: putative Ig domain-containing protein, partial [Candidatus Sulfotelmatobacter sp.]|nr:putative Ig domain-containing protein [Candidatus Sulfotelmatobacter sp.]